VRYLVDRALCSAHGRCEATAPGVYRLDDEGFNAVLGREVTIQAGHEDAARQGAAACPDAAIRVFEDRG
jgi:ferredoxin